MWLESAPEIRISQLDVKASADGTVLVEVHSSDNATGLPVVITVLDQDGGLTALETGGTGTPFTVSVPFARTWSPDTPNLYDITVIMADDEVDSYTGFRTIGKGMVNDVQRPMLNGEFVFQFATLDQGFWPDGIYLAPTYDAMIFDLQVLKDLGFNTVRKHVSISSVLISVCMEHSGG